MHIRDINSSKLKKLTLDEIYDIIELKLSPLVSSILPVIDSLLKDIDDKYSEKLVKI
jgi:molecular chaperone GrpE (heat shock protein)